MHKLIPMLLKFDGYPSGVVVALLLHGLLLYIFLPKDFEPADQVRIEPMSFVVASAVKQSPQQLRRLNQLENERRNEEAERDRRQAEDQQRARDAAVAEERRLAEVAQRDAERRRIEEEQEREREREEERRRVTEEQENERRRARDLANERAAADAARIAAANNAEAQSAENQLVSQYMGIIHDRISRAWNIPPDARNGMLAIVQLRLTPTGEIIAREIVQSSGNTNFDRSVLAAVDRVGRIPELQDMPSAVFERKFRAGIILEFSPEDLLR